MSFPQKVIVSLWAAYVSVSAYVLMHDWFINTYGEIHSISRLSGPETLGLIIENALIMAVPAVVFYKIWDLQRISAVRRGIITAWLIAILILTLFSVNELLDWYYIRQVMPYLYVVKLLGITLVSGLVYAQAR